MVANVNLNARTSPASSYTHQSIPKSPSTCTRIGQLRRSGNDLEATTRRIRVFNAFASVYNITCREHAKPDSSIRSVSYAQTQRHDAVVSRTRA